MKLYNPFKNHIVQFSNGKYGIRCLSLFHFGWVYKDFVDNYYWPKESEYFNKDCMLNNLEHVNLFMVKDKVI